MKFIFLNFHSPIQCGRMMLMAAPGGVVGDYRMESEFHELRWIWTFDLGYEVCKNIEIQMKVMFWCCNIIRLCSKIMFQWEMRRSSDYDASILVIVGIWANIAFSPAFSVACTYIRITTILVLTDSDGLLIEDEDGIFMYLLILQFLLHTLLKYCYPVFPTHQPHSLTFPTLTLPVMLK